MHLWPSVTSLTVHLDFSSYLGQSSVSPPSRFTISSFLTCKNTVSHDFLSAEGDSHSLNASHPSTSLRQQCPACEIALAFRGQALVEVGIPEVYSAPHSADSSSPATLPSSWCCRHPPYLGKPCYPVAALASPNKTEKKGAQKWKR